LLCKEGTFVSLQHLARYGLSPDTFPEPLAEQAAVPSAQGTFHGFAGSPGGSTDRREVPLTSG
jgi:hypothetical protein